MNLYNDPVFKHVAAVSGSLIQISLVTARENNAQPALASSAAGVLTLVSAIAQRLADQYVLPTKDVMLALGIPEKAVDAFMKADNGSLSGALVTLDAGIPS